MSAPALPTICPRCPRRLVRNHDELVCLTHGQVFEPIRAWETAAAVVASGVTARGGEQKRVRGMSPTAVPWTDEERDLWRRAEAGEEFAPPEPEEEEPMSEFAPKSADDLGGPALARLRELAAQVEKAEALAQSLRAEALRFVAVHTPTPGHEKRPSYFTASAPRRNTPSMTARAWAGVTPTSRATCLRMGFTI